MRLCNYGKKVLYCFYVIFPKNARKSETSQPCLYILLYKHTYRPMRARVPTEKEEGGTSDRWENK